MKKLDINEYSNFDFLTKIYSRSYGLQIIDKLISSNREFSIFYIDPELFITL